MPDPDNAGNAPDNSGSDEGYVSGDGVFAENWSAQLGEEFKEDSDTLLRFKNVKELSKSYMEARKKIGMNPDSLVKIPDENSTDEERAAFHKARGKPETVEGYEYEIPKELAAKVEVNDERLGKFKDFAFEKLHLSPSEFKDALDFYYGDMAEAAEAFGLQMEESEAKNKEESERELKKELGMAYKDRILDANAILQEYGGVDAVKEFGAQNSPNMVRFLTNIANVLGEPTMKGLRGKTAPSRADLDDQIHKLKLHPGYTDRSNPEHKKLNEQVQELYKQKYPA